MMLTKNKNLLTTGEKVICERNIKVIHCFSLLTCDLESAGPCCLLFCCCACSCWICSNDFTGWHATGGLSAQPGTPRACCSRCWACSCCNLSSRCCLSLSSCCCCIWASDMVPDTGVGAPHRDPPETYKSIDLLVLHRLMYNWHFVLINLNNNSATVSKHGFIPGTLVFQPWPLLSNLSPYILLVIYYLG